MTEGFDGAGFFKAYVEVCPDFGEDRVAWLKLCAIRDVEMERLRADAKANGIPMDHPEYHRVLTAIMGWARVVLESGVNLSVSMVPKRGVVAEKRPRQPINDIIDERLSKSPLERLMHFEKQMRNITSDSAELLKRGDRALVMFATAMSVTLTDIVQALMDQPQ